MEAVQTNSTITSSPQTVPSPQQLTEGKITAGLQRNYERLIVANPNAAICPLCQGMGSVGIDGLDIDSPFFGRAFPCPCGQNKVKPQTQKLFADVRVPEKYRTYTFESWYELLRNGALNEKRRPLDMCWKLANQGYIETKRGRKCGIVLEGSFGVGKSSMAAAIAISCHEAGRSVLWQDFNQIIQTVQQTYRKDSKTSRLELTKAAGSVDVLILDDVGGTRDDDHFTSDKNGILYDILRPRWENQRMTIIPTNMSQERWKQEIDGRLYRRVRELCVWTTVGGINMSEGQYT